MITGDLAESRSARESRLSISHQDSYLEKQIHDNLSLMKLDLDRDREIKKEFFGTTFTKSINFQGIMNSVNQALELVATSKLDNVEFRKHPELKNVQS